MDLLSPDSATRFARLLAVYRSPGPNRQPDVLQYCADMCNCIDSLFPSNCTTIICGDFNVPDINWNQDNCLKCNTVSCTGLILSLYYKHGLQQLVTQPTRNDNILDLVFTNDFNSVVDVKTNEPFSNSDHNTVNFSIVRPHHNNSACTATYRRYFYDFNRADWNSILYYLLSVDFMSIFNSAVSIADACDTFYNILYHCIHSFVPVKLISLKANPKCKTRRYPFSIKRLANKKLSAWRRYRKTRTTESREQYNKAAAKCRLSTRKFIADSERQLVAKGNIGQFYRYANKKFCSKSSIGPIKTQFDTLVTDPSLKAEIFNNTFASYFIQDNGVLPDDNFMPNVNPLNCTISNILFTESSVRRAIKRLKLHSAGGPDEIPPVFYRKCINVLSRPLSLLFSHCFSCSYLPPIWLTGNIVPIFKKGDRTDANNYRPIALTCTACKLMESVIKDQLLSYLLNNKLISRHQHAFISKHSTASNLIECVHDWLVSLNSARSTDVIYVDFSRAYDSIVISKLLFKIRYYGFSGNLFNWIEQFLSNRSQRTVIDNCSSSFIPVTSGVPQGSVLGPILFLLFINDLDSVCCFLSRLKLFADDAKFYSETVNRSSGTLQLCADRLCNWAEICQLGINVKKCYVVTVTNSYATVSSQIYYINNIAIASADSVLDLGISINYDLSFRTHIETIVAKCYQRLSVLFRGFVTRNLIFLRRAFITFVRPILEYNSVVWSPTEIYLIDLIEQVQRYFTRNIPAIKESPYSDRLSALNLQLLELRRLHFDLIYYYKIFNNLTPHDPSDFFIIYHPPSSSRSESSYLQKPVKGTKKFHSFLAYRSTAAWNYLPVDLKQASSVASFKQKLRQINLNQFLLGTATK